MAAQNTDAKTAEFMTPGEVARRFRVDAKTVTRWAKDGKIKSFRTPGGHRRFYAAEIESLIKNGETRNV